MKSKIVERTHNTRFSKKHEQEEEEVNRNKFEEQQRHGNTFLEAFRTVSADFFFSFSEEDEEEEEAEGKRKWKEFYA